MNCKRGVPGGGVTWVVGYSCSGVGGSCLFQFSSTRYCNVPGRRYIYTGIYTVLRTAVLFQIKIGFLSRKDTITPFFRISD